MLGRPGQAQALAAPPQRADQQRRDPGEHGDVQAGDAHQVGHAGGAEDVPVGALDGVLVAHDQGRQQAGGLAVGDLLEHGIAHRLPGPLDRMAPGVGQALRRRDRAGRRARSRWPAGPAPTATARSRSRAGCCCRAAPSAARSAASARRRAGRPAGAAARRRRRPPPWRRRTSPGRAAAPARTGAPAARGRLHFEPEAQAGLVALRHGGDHAGDHRRRGPPARDPGRAQESGMRAGRSGRRRAARRPAGLRLARAPALSQAIAGANGPARQSAASRQPRARPVPARPAPRRPATSHSAGCCSCNAGPSTAPSRAGVIHPPRRGLSSLRMSAFSTAACTRPADLAGHRGRPRNGPGLASIDRMSIHAALNHVTHYRYDRPVQLGPQVVRLRPAPHSRSTIVSYSLKVEPAQHFINWQQDPFANYQARLVFPEKTTEFKVTVDLVVEMAVYNPFDFFLEPERRELPVPATSRWWRRNWRPTSRPSRTRRCCASYLGQGRSQAAAHHRLPGGHQPEAAARHPLPDPHGAGRADARADAGATPAAPAATRGWLLVQLLRRCGLAARFVSGYLIQLTPDVKSLDGPSGTSVDFTDLHAWCEVYLPGAGWIGLDPTSGPAGRRGPHPAGLHAAALRRRADRGRGRRRRGRVQPSHAGHAHPRVAARHQALHRGAMGAGAGAGRRGGPRAAGRRRAPDHGRRADLRRRRATATPPNGTSTRWARPSAAYAIELVHKLRDEYGRGGFLHFGQGKWYPGEQLPRWALSICWRADGQPVWNEPGAVRRRTPGRALHQRGRRALRAGAGGNGWASATGSSSRATRTSSTTSGASAGCR